MRKLHQTIKKVSEDVPALSYNTAIAAMMEYMNVVRRGERTAHRAEVEPLVQLVAPFAPHVAEELWERLGHDGERLRRRLAGVRCRRSRRRSSIEIAVQVNGKMRGTIRSRPVAARRRARARRWRIRRSRSSSPATPKKIIFVPRTAAELVIRWRGRRGAASATRSASTIHSPTK